MCCFTPMVPLVYSRITSFPQISFRGHAVCDPAATSITPLVQTELFLWQLCQQYAREYPNPEHPVRSELVAAFVPRAVRLMLLRHLASDVLKGIDATAEIFAEPQVAKSEACR